MTSTHFPRIYKLPAFVAIAVCFSSLVLHGQAPGAARESKPGDPNENAEVVLLEEFSVTASVNDTSIKADETVGALRVNTQLIESPITVAVLKPEFLEAFLLTEEQEQASYVAGSNLSTDWGGGYTQPSLRGFPVPYFRNGFRRTLSSSTANTERIEYVKGPMAATFGRTAPGGLVNYVTKRARKRPAFDFLYVIGPVKHRLLTTVDVTESFVDYREWRMPDINVPPTSVLRLSASNPDWTPYDRSQLTSLYQSYATRMRDIGTLVSDRMDLPKGRVLLYGSLRYDNHDTNQNTNRKPGTHTLTSLFS